MPERKSNRPQGAASAPLLAAVGPFVRGTLRRRRTKCGKDNCRCAQGDLHSTWSLTFSDGGASRTVTVPEEMLSDVRQWTENYQRLRARIERQSADRVEFIVQERRRFRSQRRDP